MLCKGPHHHVWLDNGISLPEVRLSQIMKQLPVFGLPCIDVLWVKHTQGASLSTDMLMAKLNVSTLGRKKDTFVLLWNKIVTALRICVVLGWGEVAPSCPWPGSAVPWWTEFSPDRSRLLSAVSAEVRGLPPHKALTQTWKKAKPLFLKAVHVPTHLQRKTTEPLLPSSYCVLHVTSYYVTWSSYCVPASLVLSM